MELSILWSRLILTASLSSCFFVSYSTAELGEPSDTQDWITVHFITKKHASSHCKNINGNPVPDIQNIQTQQYGEHKNILNSLVTTFDKSNENHTKYPLLQYICIFYRKILTYIWIFTFLCFVTKTYLKSINIRWKITRRKDRKPQLILHLAGI